jgi:oligopeptide/dipeptide ABC transporter ATP-binding protein
MSALLELRGLTVRFRTRLGPVTAVDRLDLEVRAGETLALVGESGCGKSVTALAVLGLLPPPPDSAVAGEVRLGGRDLLPLPPAEMRRVRGAEAAMVFQEPMTALNPVFTIGDQIAEALRAHAPLSRADARAQAKALLDLVAIPDAERRLDDYPHQLSGGMRQRALIAIAIACRPKLLIADEPTTALDVTIQQQILDLLRDLKARLGMSLILITHDLGVVAEMADRVAVMYAGRIAEEAPVRALFAAPLHPYTRGLMRASPHHAPHAATRTRLPEIPGIVPALHELPSGCAFAPRCPEATDACAAGVPPLRTYGAARRAACVRIAEIADAAP